MAMNAHFEMDSADVMRVKLEVLRREHRDLDEAIHAATVFGGDLLSDFRVIEAVGGGVLNGQELA